jgi:hypothetical protein
MFWNSDDYISHRAQEDFEEDFAEIYSYVNLKNNKEDDLLKRFRQPKNKILKLKIHFMDKYILKNKKK